MVNPIVLRLSRVTTHSDPKQALRIKRLMLGMATWLFGVVCTLPFAPLMFSLSVLLCCAVLYSTCLYLVHSGINLKFEDPSMTGPVLAVSALPITFNFYYIPAEWYTFGLMMYPILFSFGIFKLSRSQMLKLEAFILGLFLLASYLALQKDHSSLQPKAIAISCIALLMILTWFAFFAGFYSDLRMKMRKAMIKAEAANQTKGEFLALMSHELRTPMSGIIGMLNLALRDSLPAAAHERVTIANQNAASLLNILNDLLDLSKIEAGKLQLEIIDFDLRKDLQHALALLNERTREKSIFFNVHIDEALPQYVKGDPTRLRQVLLNLVGNAIKFTPHGSISVSAKLSIQTGNSYWTHFEVTDSGIGISEEAQSRLFNKFEQADTSTTRQYGGTGLGLSITKQLVELMGGTIGVKSAPGKGSTFFFFMPLIAGEAPPIETADVTQAHPYSLRILCAEDATTNQLIIEALLKEMGHQIDMVENGQLCLEALTRKEYDLILMDGRMPIMDGLTATRHIRQGHFGEWVFPDPNITIVALTANASEQDRDKFLAAGMNAVLTKPIDELQLHKTLSSVIEHCKALGKTLLDKQSDPLAELDAILGLDAAGISAEPAAAPAVAAPAPARRLRRRMDQVFIEQLPERLAEMDQAMLMQDYEKVAIVVHGMKGSMAYVWPDSPLIALTDQLEKWADSKNISELSTGLKQLRHDIEQLLTTNSEQART